MKKQPVFKLSALSASLLAFSLVNGAWGGVGNHFGLNIHENGVAWGTNAVNQLSHGVASGQGATVTRGNLTREQYQEGVRQYQSLLDEKNQLTAQKAQLEGSKELKASEIDALNSRIDELNNKITEHGNTLDEINSLNQQKQTMVDFVNNINSQITAKEGEYNLSDKTRIYEFEDFYRTLNKLDWTQYANGAGADNLANQLKARVSEFSPNIANKYGQDKYKEIINAYVNLNSIDKQPTVDWFNERLTTKDMGLDDAFKTYNELKIDGSNYHVLDFKYKNNENNTHQYYNAHTDYDNSYSEYFNNNKNNYNNEVSNGNNYNNNTDNYENYRSYSYDNGKMKNTSKIWRYIDKSISDQYLKELEWMRDSLDNTPNYSLYVTRNTLRAVLNKDAPNLKLKNVEQNDLYGVDYLTTLYANFGDINLVESLQKVINPNNNFYNDEAKNKFHQTIKLDGINNENITKANELSNNFIRDYEGVDLNATAKNVASIEETRNLFKPFYEKMVQLRDITNLYKEINSGTLDESTKQQKQAVYLQKLADYRNALNAEIDHYDTLEGYIAHFVRPHVRYSDEFVNHFKTATHEYIDFLKANRHKLLSYDPNDEFIKEISDKAKSLIQDLKNLNDQKSAKEKEIEGINNQITALNQQLSPDETALNQQKQEKEAELAKAQKEKEQLDAQVVEKEKELARKQAEVLEKLKQQSGEGNAVAIGDNSFASGVSAIALGVGSESIGDHALALGTQAKATKSDSIAIGHGAEVTGEQSIAIGKGHRVSGNRSTTIGDPNIITGDDSVAVGNNNTINSNHVMVFGNNVTVGENLHHSVVLGSNSTVLAPVATISHTIAGTQYNFAGTAPVGTVSIGAEGKERTLTNLAAGRISNTSTDGINGSQLNAVIETLNSLNTELTTLKNAPKLKTPVIKAGDGLSLTEGDDGSITLSNALTFNAGNGINVNKVGNNVTITNTQPLSDENKAKYDNASAKAETAVQPDKLKAGDGISVSKSDNGEITITNTKAFEIADKEKLNTAFDKSNTAVHPDALEAGNGISINKADGKITITNTQPLSDENKTKYDNASTTANNALEKANVNEGAINTANGRITTNEGKITTNEGKIATQDGKINDLTPRVTANEGNITTLTGKVTTVTNTANEALGKANTNAETINNVSGVANEALGKANTAVQPEMLESGNGIAINKKDGKVIISSTVNNNGGNWQATNLIAGNGISIQPNEDKTGTVITNTQAFTDADKEKLNSALQPNDLKAGSGITIANNTISNTLSFEGESGIEVNRQGDKVTIKSKPIVVNSLSVKTDQGEEKLKEKLEITGSDNIETETKNGKVIVKTKPVIKAKTLIADEMNIGGTVINSKQVNVGNKVVDGVANGEISEHSQQAINGSQIFPIVNQVNVNTQEIHQLNGRVGNIEQRIGKMRKRYEAGLAGVAAMAGVPQVMGAGKKSLGVGVGTRPGANAVAVGYSASSDNGHHIIKTSFAVDTQRKLTGNAGYSYQW